MRDSDEFPGRLRYCTRARLLLQYQPVSACFIDRGAIELFYVGFPIQIIVSLRGQRAVGSEGYYLLFTNLSVASALHCLFPTLRLPQQRSHSAAGPSYSRAAIGRQGISTTGHNRPQAHPPLAQQPASDLCWLGLGLINVVQPPPSLPHWSGGSGKSSRSTKQATSLCAAC
jgi:hypothetical protein